jgi:hypothetical protein
VAGPEALTLIELDAEPEVTPPVEDWPKNAVVEFHPMPILQEEFALGPPVLPVIDWLNCANISSSGNPTKVVIELVLLLLDGRMLTLP